MNSRELQQKTFLLLLITVSLAFALILWPFYGAVFWGAILAILFAPLYRRLLLAMHNRRNSAALVTLLICLIIVIFPLSVIAALLLQEATLVFQKISSRELDFGMYFQQAINSLPGWIVRLLEHFDLANMSSAQERLSASVVQGSQIVAKQAFSIGQNTFNFMVSFGVMLYLLFFWCATAPVSPRGSSRQFP
ncbi:MAG: family transporter [Herminiimonas sp.]|nr:family transporter [Herminiimonas sp.]